MVENLLPGLLARRGVSIRQLARDTGITYSTIWAMVHSQRRSVQLEVLDAVCAALEVQPGDIYKRVTEGNASHADPGKHVAPGPQANAKERTTRAVQKEDSNEWRSW